MNWLVNGAGFPAQRGAGQYQFSPQGTADQNWNLVQMINGMTVALGTPRYQPLTGNYSVTAGMPAQVVDLCGNPQPPTRWWIGRAWNANWKPFQAMYYTTNENTLILGKDCRSVVTSFPGTPNQ